MQNEPLLLVHKGQYIVRIWFSENALGDDSAILFPELADKMT